MAAKNWSDEQVTKVEELEAILFRDDVTEVQIVGDGEVKVQAGSKSFVAEDLSFPDEILHEFVNELLLPYVEAKPQPKKVSKSGNPAKRAAENDALGVVKGSQTSQKVRGTTVVHEADLNLPHSTDKDLSIRVRESSVWPPKVPTAVITLTKKAATV